MARDLGNDIKFQCIVFETDERFQGHVQNARLENVTHNLVRIQRWAKRMLRRARVRLVLLMALHPRLGAKAGIAVLGPDLLLACALLQTRLPYTGSMSHGDDGSPVLELSRLSRAP